MSQVNYVSYRLTTSDREVVFDIFKGTCCVIAEEFSKQGVQHYHVVVKGHDAFELVKKRLLRAKLGRNKYWSKKNHGNDYMKALSYTVKCGEYWTRKHMHEDVDRAPEWVVEEEPVVADGVKDTDKDWLLTWSNLLRVAYNWKLKHQLPTTRLKEVLVHMSANSRWIPSREMLRSRIDIWYHRMFEWRCGDRMAPPPHEWMEPPVGAENSLFYGDH